MVVHHRQINKLAITQVIYRTNNASGSLLKNRPDKNTSLQQIIYYRHCHLRVKINTYFGSQGADRQVYTINTIVPHGMSMYCASSHLHVLL